MMIGGVRGTTGREKTYVLVFVPFQNVVPRKGHCLRAKLSLNETKKGVGDDVAVAAWQNPQPKGGGEHWQQRNKRVPCQREGM